MLEAAIRQFLSEWTGPVMGRQTAPGEPGWAHFVDCAANREGQLCCLDVDHEQYEAFVSGLVAAVEAYR